MTQARGPKKWLSVLGPGLVTGTADDDPAGITTYSQAGAQFQYGLLWTALLQIPLMIAVQLMVARLGIVSGRDLTRVIRDEYPRWVIWFVCVLLIIANVITAGADIAGIAAGAQLIVHVPPLASVIVFTLLMIALVTFLSYRVMEDIFKWLTLALLGYLFAGVLARPEWGLVLRRTLVPGFRHGAEYLTTFVGIFGTTISPYLFVWQSAEEVAELKQESESGGGGQRLALWRAKWDTIIGMTISQVIGYFIIVAAGATLYPNGVREIGTAREAAQALQPIGGGIGTLLFSIGLIGTGLLAVPTLVGSATYAVAAIAGWRGGIASDWRRAKAFYGVMAIGMVLGGALAATGINPVALLFGSAVLNGLLAPPMLVIVLLVANNRGVMQQAKNGWLMNALGLLALLIMGSTSLWLVAHWVRTRLGG